MKIAKEAIKRQFDKKKMKSTRWQETMCGWKPKIST